MDPKYSKMKKSDFDKLKETINKLLNSNINQNKEEIINEEFNKDYGSMQNFVEMIINVFNYIVPTKNQNTTEIELNKLVSSLNNNVYYEVCTDITIEKIKKNQVIDTEKLQMYLYTLFKFNPSYDDLLFIVKKNKNLNNYKLNIVERLEWLKVFYLMKNLEIKQELEKFLIKNNKKTFIFYDNCQRKEFILNSDSIHDFYYYLNSYIHKNIVIYMSELNKIN